MNQLPTWDEMSDLDKGAALLHVWKREWEGAAYAVEEYPCEYFDHPALTALTREQACEHAEAVTGGHENILTELGDEHERLYDAALDADRKRLREEMRRK